METKSSFYFGVAPMVERVAVNHLVGGSNPSPEAARQHTAVAFASSPHYSPPLSTTIKGFGLKYLGRIKQILQNPKY